MLNGKIHYLVAIFNSTLLSYQRIPYGHMAMEAIERLALPCLNMVIKKKDIVFCVFGDGVHLQL